MRKRRVAVVGCSFRLPGSNSDGFWSDLLAGRDFVTRIDPGRWAQHAYLHPRKSHPGTSYTGAAGSLGDVSAFDADFFGISPREAAQMDPQQRLLLELSWEALENSGIKPSEVRGSQSGVFIGISTNDYSLRLADDLTAIDMCAATGTSSSIAANRISYMLDLHGPSLALDTACSSSLYAFHLACRAILGGECPQAIAGGVSVHTHPFGFVTFAKASMLSRQGACKVFDAAGDGYVRSEGGAVFMLKDYDRALADGDPVLAVVAGSVVNCDGKTSSLTVPSVGSQIALLTQAYAEAGIDASEIDYVEAHGTGTAVGDPVEAQALGEALGQHRPTSRPLLIGSVKSNLGHLEAAAGVAGLVKALYCLQHRALPPNIHFNDPNPNIRFDDWNLKVVSQPTPLAREGKLVIGINSFGFGGANAHVILESPEISAGVHRHDPPAVPLPVLLSAKSAAALKAAARGLSAFVRNQNELSLYDIAYSAVLHREWHEHRAIILADSNQLLAGALAKFAGDEPGDVPALIETDTALPCPAGPAFIYPGNGAVWDGMGRRLMEAEPLFRKTVLEVNEIFRRLAGHSLEDELSGKNAPGRYQYAEIAQPALFALQVGITQMLRRRGITPTAVAGHSVGELAAAWASGALSLEQAVGVVYHRSRLQGTTKGTGQMTAVALGESAARESLQQAGLSRVLSIAAINGSSSVTVAGEVSALEHLERTLAERRVSHKRLDFDYAFHSPAMDTIAAELVQALADLRPAETRIPFHSTVTGGPLTGTALGADYWWRNVRDPVQFERAIASILSTGVNIFSEIGPHALLRGYIGSCMRVAEVAGRVVPTLLRDDDSPERIWHAIGQIMIAGAPVDWKALFPVPGRFVRLPNYPWQRERHWHFISPESRQRLNRHCVHPLLGYRLHEIEWGWESDLDTQLCPALADHVIGGAIVLPGAAYAEMALAAGRLWQDGEIVDIEHLEIRSPLILSDTQSKIVRFSIDAPDGSFSIKSRDYLAGASWTEHAVGRLLKDPRAMPPPQAPLVLPARPPDYTGADHDRLTRALGLDYGPAFRALDAVWVEEGSACARLSVPPAIELELKDFQLHPALLDCTFQLIIELLGNDSLARTDTVYVPTRIEGLLYRSGNGAPALARATLHRLSPHAVTASFALFDAEGELVARIRETRFNGLQLHANASDRLRYVECHWVPMPHPSVPGTTPRQLFDRLQRDLSELAHSAPVRSTLRRYTHQIEPLLDALCSRYAVQALRSLANKGDVLTDVQAVAAANPEAAPLLLHLIAMLEEDKAIAAVGNEWRILPDADLPNAQDIWNCLVADYPDYLPVLHAVGRVGMYLVDLLLGRMALDDALPRECTLSQLTRRALSDAGTHGLERAIRNVMTQVLGELPTGKRFRILELGAGKPSFAAGLCKSLDFNRCDYVCATTAPCIPDECHQWLERYPAAEMRLLDADGIVDRSAPPVPDPFELAIVTSDFASEHEVLFALAYAQRHLSPGGSILVIEQHRSRWSDLVFGARQAWWSVNADGSWSSRHKSGHWWRQQMQRLGFQAGATLELSGDGASGPYLILSRVAEQTGAVPRPTAPAARNWLLLADKEGFSARLADQVSKTLEAQGACVVRATPGSRFTALDPRTYEIDPYDPAHYATVFARVHASLGPLHGIVHLHGLGTPAGDAAPLLALDQQVDRCAATAAIVRAGGSPGSPATCWLVTALATSGSRPAGERQNTRATVANSMDAALWGFGRTLMNEHSNAAVRLVDIDNAAALDTLTYTLVREISHPDSEQEVALTASGARYVPRLYIAPPPATLPLPQAAPEETLLSLGLRSRGQVNHLQWESCPRVPPGDEELEIEVRATGLNFRDVMYTLGFLSDEALEGGFAGSALGLEFSGVVTGMGEGVRGFAAGDRVVGFAPASFGNRVVTHAGCAYPIPARLSFEAAATLPSAFLTAHYALNHLARLQESERILIHGAAGGVGIAAIQFAKRCGAETFATAGSTEKRDFLRLLGVDHVFDSRSLAFADEILALTEGGGVDVVLNSLAGEAINRNLRVLKPFGRYLELGKRDFQQNTKIGLRPFRHNISYFAIDTDQLIKERPDLTQTLFREIMTLVGDGALHPLPYRCYEADEIADAFRCMQRSRHIGKIVVTYENGIQPAPVAQRHRRTLQLPPDATYLVTGGLGGFGLKVAQWLASKGARNLVLAGRSGPVAPEARAAIATLAQAGVTVHAAACDVSDARALSNLLSDIAVTLPPLRGIVHAAAVIEDGLIANTNRDQIRRVFAPKILGAHHLHQLTLGKALDFFIVFSSATTLFGNPGQGSYVAANACLEALAARRRAAGLPALCICWGAIDDAGYLARNPRIKEALQDRMGGSAIPSAVALEALEQLLLADSSGAGILEFDWKALTRFLPSANTPRYSELARSAANVDAGEPVVDDVRRLLTTLSTSEVLAALGEILKADVAEILRTSAERIDEQRPLHDMGLDSLMGVELATAIEARLGVRLPVLALSENPTIVSLSARLLEQLSGVNEPGASAGDASVADQARRIAAQHADDEHADVIATAASHLDSGEPAPASRIIR